MIIALLILILVAILFPKLLKGLIVGFLLIFLFALATAKAAELRTFPFYSVEAYCSMISKENNYLYNRCIDDQKIYYDYSRSVWFAVTPFVIEKCSYIIKKTGSDASYEQLAMCLDTFAEQEKLIEELHSKERKKFQY